MKSLIETLGTKGYKKSFEDSWQFWKGEEIDKSRFGTVKKVDSEEMLKVYLETFDSCYQKDDPENPYGELGEYLELTENVWHKHNGTGRLEYFIAYKDEKPVAVSALTNFEGLGYISNVGSLREVRGEGFGKLVTHYCVSQSIENGNMEHCLATEEGAYPFEFYKRIGFETRFTASAYTKDISTLR
jgi:ribosomal protein S18 acetylase RimI-like enzyme